MPNDSEATSRNFEGRPMIASVQQVRLGPPSDVSIVIPCFNAGKTLARAIESALAQSGLSTEIVVIDDGSTDSSLEIARKFAPRVSVVTQPNRGVSVARNEGIAQTIGHWIVFLDADDALLKDTLRARVDCAESTGADVIICNWQEFLDDSDAKTDFVPKSIDVVSLEKNPEVACATHCWATTAALMYRRSLVRKIAGFRHDLPIIQDARFLFDAAYHGARFAHAAHCGARYCVSEQSLSRRKPELFWRDVLTNGKQIEALWRLRGNLTAQQQDALAGIYDQAARGLFEAGCPQYFDAIRHQRRITPDLPLYPRIAAPLAHTIGLQAARQILSWFGR